MARFFIDRPIFAWVIAIIIMLAGVLSIARLPIAQYPPIAPPAVTVTSIYPGASAEIVDTTVTQVIEQQMRGIDNLRYILSNSDSTGQSTIELTFDQGTDPDIAQIQVQNKLTLANPRLPDVVQRQGVTVAKSTKNFLVVIAFYSADRSMSRGDIADFLNSVVADPLGRVPGVGDVQVFGSQYAMRIWLEPDALAQRNLTAVDVTRAVQAQNVQVSAGQFGGVPAVRGQQLNATITAKSRLQKPEQFEQILLRVNPDGSRVLLRDVARVELTSETFDQEAYFNDQPSAAIAVRLSPGANAIDTSNRVRAQLEELKTTFPPNMRIGYPLDSIPFIKLSIEEVVRTLLIAIALVVLVMFLFLQNLRATLIPTLAVPVVLLGTFGVLSLFGYSINTLTMFAMVLAIGLLVDDAIVVVENVVRLMHEEHLSPRDAARKSMDQITGALVGIALVIATVFIPMAFVSGSAGVIYRQFSVTIVTAITLSVLVAIVFTPALCATILKPGLERRRRGLFRLFNRGFERTQRGYSRTVGRLAHHRLLAMIAYLAIGVATALLFTRLPTGFLPNEDQGQVFVQVQLPPGSTQEETRDVMKQVSEYLLKQEEAAVDSVIAVVGFSFIGSGQNVGVVFVKLRDWSVRDTAELRAPAVVARTMRALAGIKSATVIAFQPPPILELGFVAGFQMQIEDRAGLGHDALMQALDQVIARASKDPGLVRVRSGGLPDRPQYKLEVDETKASAFGITLADINTSISSTWGASYVNDFLDRGRTKRVFMQADAPYRMQPSDLARWYVRNARNEMVPFSAFATGRWTFGPQRLDRFNGFATATVQGEPAPGHSSGEALRRVGEIASDLPAGFAHEWYGPAYEELKAGAGVLTLYALSLLVVFLCLAALYESWSIPASVLLVVPLGAFGSVIASLLGRQSNDVYFQVGILAVIGLAAKNAILIVEFAKDAMDSGKSAIDAAVEASHLRLRPIVMTSLAFVLGVFPLAISSGAGSGAQNAIGIAIVGGTLAATILGLLLVPVFFVVIRGRRRAPETPVAPGGAHA
ncbi:MAG: efflux RND transporter permease subunit [Deltaproteobacteria bacterium]|nr:efflux RND transporter permease subunit [Deltaproteobacteria bacterium]MCW5806076.1 efflux RND transporter permease subunit [Deltaproteobacteria bacterium]